MILSLWLKWLRSWKVTEIVKGARMTNYQKELNKALKQQVPDISTHMAAYSLSKNINSVTPKERANAKALNYQYLYTAEGKLK